MKRGLVDGTIRNCSWGFESKNALLLSGLVAASGVYPDADTSGTDQSRPRTTPWS